VIPFVVIETNKVLDGVFQLPGKVECLIDYEDVQQIVHGNIEPRTPAVSKTKHMISDSYEHI
jgi:hypothetical protein